MKKLIAALLALALVLAVAPAVLAASTPADYGWESDGTDYSGWTVTDANNFTISSNGSNNYRIWKTAIDDTANFSVAVTIAVGSNARAYIKALNIPVELNCSGGDGSQIFCKETSEWFDAADQTCAVSVSRKSGGKLTISLTGKGNPTPVTYTVSSYDESRTQVELGVYDVNTGASFSDLSIVSGSASAYEGAASPEKYGWFTDADDTGKMDFSGWYALDAANLYCDLSSAVHDRMMLGSIGNQAEFSVTLSVDIDVNSSAYVKVLGQTLELDGRHGTGDQAYIKFNGVGNDWLEAAGAACTITLTRTDSGSIAVSITGKGNPTPMTGTLTPSEESENLELGLYEGRAVFSSISVVSEGGDSAGSTGVFADVPSSAYYNDAVIWAAGKGVTTGTSDTTFSPDTACTRAQTVTFLWRAMGSPQPDNTACPFTDVAAGAYYYKAVLWAVGAGITDGTSATTFSPDSTVTRGQTVTFLWRAAGKLTAGTANPFTDIKDDAYYYGAVLWAVDTGITTGTSATTFTPLNSCTRAQIVTFLYRYIGI